MKEKKPTVLTEGHISTIGYCKLDGQETYIHSDEPRELEQIIAIIIHSMHLRGAEEWEFDAEACVAFLTFHGLSTHFLIERNGKTYDSVPLEYRAWHAGKSKYPDEEDTLVNVNGTSIGIELLANETAGFTDEQYRALVGLVAQIVLQLPTIRYILGHEHIAGEDIRPQDPKTDPWNFDWDRFAELLAQELKSKKNTTK